MIAISFRFLAGRYHATPWGRHVNEGAVEWPPAPWRILRALVAVWKRTLPELSQPRVEAILRKLATPPEFLLPRASTGHTRHFVPWFKKGPDDRTLVFDTFVLVLRNADVVVRWPDASLDDREQDTLMQILANLNILGRSESWCEASLTGSRAASDRLICRPLHEQLPTDHEIVRLLCPEIGSAFADDHVVKVTTKTIGRGKNRHTIEERFSLYDPAWNLCMDTLELHEEKWSDPPGSRWVTYARPRDCFKIEPVARSPTRARLLARIQVVQYALDSTVLPLVIETLPVAEAARRALMSVHGWLTERNGVRGRSRVFSGKNDQGEPLDGHRHAYYLPTDEDGDGRLDHLTVVSRDGLGENEVCAVDRLRSLNTGREVERKHNLRLVLIGMGSLDDRVQGPLGAAREWKSVTPYIATRYAKTRGRHRRDLASQQDRIDFLLEDVRDQLRLVLGIDASAAHVEAIADEHGVFKVSDRWRPIQFQRYRRKRSDDGGRRLAGAFRIRFQEPVVGPVALGHSAHFGMGLFRPVNGDSR